MDSNEYPQVREQVVLDRLRGTEKHLIFIIPIERNIQMVNMVQAIHNNMYLNGTVYIDEREMTWLKDDK